MNNSKKVLIAILLLILFIGIYAGIIYLYNNKKNSTPAKEEVAVIDNTPLYSADTFPKIDASLATQPLTDAIYEDFVGESAEGKIDYSNTHPGYVKLINDCNTAIWGRISFS